MGRNADFCSCCRVKCYSLDMSALSDHTNSEIQHNCARLDFCNTILGSSFSCKTNGPKPWQRAKSRQTVRVTLTLACSALKREMECQSNPGSQGGAPRAIKPHTRALHVFCMPLFPEYILTVNCAAYVRKWACVYMVSPGNPCPVSRAHVCEIPAAALECEGGDNYHCHLGGRMPSDKAA